ncbi:MAG: glycoside hydrolase family 9 protein [Anaerolineaceae bacterium]|nr:glycoside hydrolase family 9 protein [Anaerolineaceae bacterium]
MKKRDQKIFLLMVFAVLFLFTGCNPQPVQEENSTETSVPAATVTPTVIAGELAPPEIQGEVVYIPFPVEIKMDGELEDWKNVPVIEVVDENAIDPAENGSFSYSVAADMETFYITMQMPDQNIIAGQHGADFWNEDSFEFFINASGDLDAKTYTDGVFQINLNGADIGNTDPQALTITGVFCTGIEVEGFVFKTDEGWGIEVSVPLDQIIEPAHGAEIGFQAQINGATTKDRDVKITWSKADTSDESWKKPYLFGTGMFVEAGNSDIPEASKRAVISAPVPTPKPVIIPELISVNQSGYFVDSEKIAILASDDTESVAWDLLDANGDVVLDGLTTIKGDDVNSGEHLHSIDFSAYNTPGMDYMLLSADLESVSFDISDELYSQLRYDALAYFYHNRSGTEIESDFVGEEWARAAGHISDDDITCYKGTDLDGVEWPGCEYTLDVSGGWYDAGDFGKYVVNGGISVWTLMDLYERFPQAYPDGSLRIPESENGVADILDEARWEMEFLLSMQVPEGEDLAGMVHHKIHDLDWAPLPMIPPLRVDNDKEHQYVGAGRYLYAPSTAATLNLAATGAQCARIWADIDEEFADRCLTAAETAWQAALDNPAIYAGNNPGDGGGNYDDDDVSDEFYWAAAELYITSGDEAYAPYLTDLSFLKENEQFDWGITAPLGAISMAVNNATFSGTDSNAVIIAHADKLIGVQKDDGYAVLIDGPYPWGSNGLILNNMMQVSIAYDLTGEDKYLNALHLSMDYLLGRNALNCSFITGYGEYPSEHPHHRFWAYDSANGYPPAPAGAVIGGPNFEPVDEAAVDAGLLDEAPAKRYIDNVESASTNEVAINWNAPLVWIATYLDTIR